MAEHVSRRRIRLVNPRAQPVELHLGANVRVLAAGQDIEVSEALLALPQLAYLLGRKALVVRELPTPPPAPPAPKSNAGAGINPRRRVRKTAAKTARPPQPPKRKKGS